MSINREDRRAAVAAWKERKPAPGIFAVRCTATGQCWVGRAPDVTTVWNRLGFTLARGSHLQRGLQDAWHRHGAAAFQFEALETVEEEIESVRDRLLKNRLAHWRAALAADLV